MHHPVEKLLEFQKDIHPIPDTRNTFVPANRSLAIVAAAAVELVNRRKVPFIGPKLARVRLFNLGWHFPLQVLHFSALCGPNEQKFGTLLT